MPYYHSNTSYGVMPDRLPKLTSFEQALAHFKSVKPYSKGKLKGSAPLGEKRSYSRSLIEYTPHDPHLLTHHGECVFLSYYDNRVVRLYADGTKRFSTCGWHSISTHHFLNETSSTGHAFRFERNKGVIYLVKDDIYYMFPDQDDIVVHPDGSITGYKVPVYHRMDGEVMLRLKKQYAPFTTFVRDMLTINQHVATDSELDALPAYTRSIMSLPIGKSLRGLRPSEINYSYKSMVTLFSHIDEALRKDGDEQRAIFYEIATRFNHLVWSWNWGRMGNVEPTLDAGTAVRHFNELIKFHFAKLIFKRERITPRNTAVHDSNEHYMIHQINKL